MSYTQNKSSDAQPQTEPEDSQPNSDTQLQTRSDTKSQSGHEDSGTQSGTLPANLTQSEYSEVQLTKPVSCDFKTLETYALLYRDLVRVSQIQGKLPPALWCQLPVCPVEAAKELRRLQSEGPKAYLR